MEKMTLSEWRRAKGLSRNKMAKAIGVCPSTIYKWEKSGRGIPIDKAYAAADLFGVSIDEISFF